MIFVGFITLCIGGIGVMNIMLASVKSRIREIGTVMAIGAKRRHVLLQFLFETLILTSAGGVLGYLAALGAAHLIGGIPFLGVIFEDTSGQGDITLVVGGGAFVTAFVVLAGVSLFFGLWPARQAARQEPVEALRYE
jgi:putative ABC transport system permease protein